MTAASPSPLALQLAVRIEKTDPPELADVFEATARAVITLLDDERSHPGGEWHDDVAAWNGARIRKIVRRARGAAWERAQSVPGLTVSSGSAEVRAFLPGPIDEAPPEVAKLQIQSTPLPELEVIDALSPPDVPTLTIGLNPAVEMSWGKQAAQVGHAAQRCWQKMSDAERLEWEAAGRTIIVVRPSQRAWDEHFADAPTQIRDGGYTEVARGTNTCAAELRYPEGAMRPEPTPREEPAATGGLAGILRRLLGG